MIRKKLLKLEVSQGVDFGVEHWMTGDRVRIGSGTSAEMRISDPAVLETHVTCTREGGGWRYEANAEATVHRNGRLAHSGKLKPGDTIVLGDTTVLTVRKEMIPADASGVLADEPEVADVPMPVVLGLVGVIILGFFGAAYVMREKPQEVVQVTIEDRINTLDAHFSECVHGLAPEKGASNTARIEPSKLFWRAGFLADEGDGEAAEAVAGVLYDELEQAIRRGSLLQQTGNWDAAQDAFRHVRVLLPGLTGSGVCPIVAQAQRDLANLKKEAAASGVVN